MKAVLIHTTDDASTRELFFRDIIMAMYTDWKIEEVSYYSLPLEYYLNTSPMWAIQTDNGKWHAFLRRKADLGELVRWLQQYLEPEEQCTTQ